MVSKKSSARPMRAREVKTGDVVDSPSTKVPGTVLRKWNPDTHTVSLALTGNVELSMAPDAVVRVTRVTTELNLDDTTPTVEFSSASAGY